LRANPTRPFYGSFAWAYDLLSDRPIASECAQIASLLSDRGLPSDARLLDAGCGTGRHAVALAGRGYRVTGLDASADLVAVARQRAGAAAVTFVTADLTALPAAPPQYDAILCRGVLNDLVDDRTRRDAFQAFAGGLVSGGAVVLDVREWEATARRKTREPVHERTVRTVHGTLTFRSETRLDYATRRLLITERHLLTSPERTTSADYDFVMRCWTRAELDALVGAAGFTAVEYLASFDRASPMGSTDRLVVVASRS
jgi:glycine/sarcosine N-methyltransferase